MKRSLIVLLGLTLLAPMSPTGASHNPDVHSNNLKFVANFTDNSTYRSGSDIAFWKNLGIFGNLTPGGFRVMDISSPKAIHELGQFTCVSSQADVSVWESIVFVSVDTPMASDKCDAAPATPVQFLAGQEWEGIRIVSIADPANPQLIGNVQTDCGSHTHTLVPQLDYKDPATGAKAPRLLLYVLSYPLRDHNARCNPQVHRKISIIEVPLSNPAAAKVIGTPSVAPAIGCHDVTYFPQRNLAGAACLTESQLWDVADPANPKVLSHITNDQINIHHSSGFSWDGKVMVLGDELGGAVVAPGCQDDSPFGSLWFYNVKDPVNPQVLSSYKIPQREQSDLCTAHNFNIIPLARGRDVLVSGWYNGGTTVVDFTLPELPKQVAYYIPKDREAVSWSSYWYNGRIYVNNYEAGAQSRGIDVFQLKHKLTKRAIKLPFMNPQTQLPFKEPKKKKRGRR